ncbi:MAG: hypothetical protein COU31_04955 [Candidatus Magasanikbacteria bacterium CG10_big_fil_rev_8_21_14_0_10_40_10]|uniref:YrdC-like domain-containing protein n=1 Tax=Candidatus Magasanikbacteria bacterium CG10_big_fil_rev_8_21_14_0_10_40_10 TaxID=1974648 RepID=A0A2M6W2R6_9BACT|nr:MAG: hypothetical protein COU31_04955 [Candidatus Magasanikbacteria bacterium CG10_big_fil_rev_8_21_14_0_10_40_10]
MKKISKNQISQAVDLLKKGRVIVFPTETSYGLGCDATDQSAVDRVFAIKDRKSDKPLLVLVADLTMAKEYLLWNSRIDELAGRYWPGPLTIIGRVSQKRLAKGVESEQGTLAVRVSPHPIVQLLINKLGRPIVATSANLSGAKNIYRSGEIKSVFTSRPIAPDAFLDMGELPKRPASAIVDATGAKIKIIRTGELKIDFLATNSPAPMNPAEIKSACQKYGLSPSKIYGQNYLISPKPIVKIIEAGQLDKQDTVVEVGPGFGILTLALARQAKQVLAFEIEKKLQPYWLDLIKQKNINNLKIIWGNVLRQASSLPRGAYKLSANLPYQITSQIIRFFLEADNQPKSMVLMLQKEVAVRICAKPGQMSLLSLAVQYYGRPKIICQVKKDCFYPVPKVASAVVAIYDIKRKNTREFDQRFFALAHAGFQNKRKLLSKNLSSNFGFKKEDWQKIFSILGLGENCRAQELSVEKWKELTKHVIHNVF